MPEQQQPPCEAHGARIAVLEVEMLHVKEAESESRQWLSSIDKKVDDIKERMDKQNGAIPHTLETVKGLEDAVGKLSEKVDSLHDATTESRLKTNLFWAILVAAVLGVVEIGIHRLAK